MKSNFFKIPLVVGVVWSLNSSGQVLPAKKFDELWNSYFKNSLQKKSLEFEKKSIEHSLARANRHWIPRAYLTGQWFSTNDPGQVFFNNLGQRSIRQLDFVPQDLNSPNRSVFKMVSLGLDFPLYEGGMKSSQVSMFHSLLKASELELEAKKSEEYATISKKYGALLIYTSKHEYLADLRNNLKKLISSYQVGSQKNPVGYSGLLGLKSVENRIQGMLSEIDLKMTNERNWISSKANVTIPWKADTSNKLNEFLKKHLTSEKTNTFSTKIFSQEEKIKTLDDMTSMEKARFRPRVGFFAQNNIYSGDRDTESSEAFGIYLQWDLFNSDSYGRVHEARAKANSAKAKLEFYKKEEELMFTQLLDSKRTLEVNLKLLEDSDLLLKEQAGNAMKLFKSGMLNALQLAEVINRRVDLIKMKTDAELQYLDVWTGIYQIKN